MSKLHTIPETISTADPLTMGALMAIDVIQKREPLSELEKLKIPVQAVLATMARRAGLGVILWNTGQYAISLENPHMARQGGYTPGSFIFTGPDEAWREYLKFSGVDPEGMPADLDDALSELWERQQRRNAEKPQSADNLHWNAD